MPIKKPKKKSYEKLPNLLVVIEQGNAVGCMSVEDVLKEYQGKNVLIRDSLNVARGNNCYFSGKLASPLVNGEYGFEIKGNKINLRLEYLMDMLVRKEG